MKIQKMLHVVWSEREKVTYYVDKDKYSKAHDLGNVIVLDAFEGTYTFNKTNLVVTLDTGTTQRQKTGVSWKFYTTPTI